MTVLANARVFDGVHGDLFEGPSVFVDGERITEISDRAPAPGDGEVVDCAGRFLMPGLIDAHVHIYAATVSVYEMAALPTTLAAGWATQVLGRMLDRGFTTVRDVGGGDYGMHLALERGWVRGPRLFYCGRLISQTGGHGDFRDPHAHGPCDDELLACGCAAVGLISAVVDGVDDVRRVVRENLRRGSNFIKFAGSGGVSSTGDRLESMQYSDDEIRVIVEEVDRHGAYCTAHIHPDGALRRAIRLGVHCVEHGTLVEPETARMAAEAGTAIVPTLAIVHALSEEGEDLGYPPQSLAKLAQLADEAVGRLQHLKDAGVTVGFGTDLLGATERHQLSEFTLRSPIFSPLELLRQATSVNAQIIGAAGDLGVVAPGAYADLLLVDGNPLDDISVLVRDGETLSAIMQRGVFVKR